MNLPSIKVRRGQETKVHEWLRLECEARLARAGLTKLSPLTQAQDANAYILTFRAHREEQQVLAAFGFEVEEGNVLEVGSVELPVVPSRAQGEDVWVATGGWPDLEADRDVFVGQVADAKLTTCRVVAPSGSVVLPVVGGVVTGWVPAGETLYFVFS